MEGANESPTDCVNVDEVEHILLSGLGAKDLGRAACVSRLWRDAFGRIKRIPQWVGALSELDEVEAAVAEACSSALARARCLPDVAYVFCTPYYEEGGMKEMHAALKKALGPIPICGCTGHAIIGTDGGASKKPVLLEDGDPALSVSLVYFAGQCEARVSYIKDRAPVPEQPRCAEKQLVFLTVPQSAGHANATIGKLCASADKAVVFGGIASGSRAGRRGETATTLFHVSARAPSLRRDESDGGRAALTPS